MTQEERDAAPQAFAILLEKNLRDALNEIKKLKSDLSKSEKDKKRAEA